ncbi:MAG: hypothetical protein LBD30_02925 [Verrucomicrobiales bacterium]|jgi:hypothetical protein|nr:hypothetical protein [Verrucomicrobiales bacterium]
MKSRLYILILASLCPAVALQAQFTLPARRDLLKENIVDVEYRVNQSRETSGGLAGFNGYQINNGHFGVHYQMRLANNLDLSHEVAFRLQSADNWDEYAAKNDTLAESLAQSQVSRLTYRAADGVKLSFFNTIGSDVRNSIADLDHRLEYGVRLEWKISPQTTLAPQLSQRTAWSANNITRQQRASFSLQQGLYKDAVSLMMTPSLLQESDGWSGGGALQNNHALDSSLRFQLGKAATVSVGNRMESLNKIADSAENTARRYYVEWQQKASDALSFRLRSEYAVKDPAANDSGRENSVRLIFGPKVSITDSLTAIAEFQYVVEQAVSEVARQATCEKIFSLSLKHNF